ncbi:MAG: ABC-F type ribosomal protection protein [Candidatus Brocadiae bacterium]|nr:ABC-F type ribosomal protection protein [Candidatus Brocadiia bacterium]
MTLIQINNIHKSFGYEDILQGIQAKIFADSRIGLVGNNGTGKTTLFKIIIQSMQEDEGEIIRQKSLKIAYLPQIVDIDENQTLLEASLEGYSELRALESKMEEIHQKLATLQDEKQINQLILQQDKLLHEYDSMGGYRYKAKTEAVLHGLGFPSEVFSQKIGHLSGGQKNRIALVRALLKESDLLLLDEPTNFLDVECTEWLEEYLKNCNQPMIVVSHDRYFLNQIAKEIWELSQGKVTSYPGNYNQYIALKRQQQEREQELYERQQEEIKRQEDFIRRNIYGERHKQAQSRRKMLAKMEIMDAPHYEDEIHLSIQVEKPAVDRIIEVTNLGHSYGSQFLFENLSFALHCGEKLAIVGPNGCGKSTLLHILTQRLKPTHGQIKIGASVTVGFYHQELHDLVMEDSVFDTIKNIIPTTDDLPIRKFLALFLFQGDDIYKKVQKLSGGEKSRLAMAKLIIQKPNFLILDEPTNHLDIQSRQALEKALKEYEGTILFVSHDRYFIDQISTRILYYYKKKWISFYGTYSQFYQSRDYLLPKEEEEKKKRTAYQRMPQQEKKKKKRYTLQDLENKIIEIEARMAEINQEWTKESIYQNPELVKTLREEYEDLSIQCKELNTEWENWAENA